jgi:hypothetical protein
MRIEGGYIVLYVPLLEGMGQDRKDFFVVYSNHKSKKESK